MQQNGKAMAPCVEQTKPGLLVACSHTALLLVVAIASGCQQGEGKPQVGAETPAIPVETSTATRGDIVAVYSGTAPIEALADARVTAKVGGEVEEILVEEGNEVRKGQLLLRLDGDRLRFEARQAEANLRKLQRDYKRHLDLREKSLISAGDFEKIQYEMEALEATYELARLELGYTEIRAPIDGVVSERFVKVGNTIEVNTPVFHITSFEPLVAYLHVPEKEYRRIRADQPATVVADALKGSAFEGNVTRVSPVVDPATGTFKITVEVSDATRRLKPGMFARISIVYDRHPDALRIPRSALLQDSEAPAVFVVDGDKAERRVIHTGYTEGGWVEIVDGLADDEEFVLVGQAGLKDGTKVSVISTLPGGNGVSALPSR